MQATTTLHALPFASSQKEKNHHLQKLSSPENRFGIQSEPNCETFDKPYPRIKTDIKLGKKEEKVRSWSALRRDDKR